MELGLTLPLIPQVEPAETKPFLLIFSPKQTPMLILYDDATVSTKGFLYNIVKRALKLDQNANPDYVIYWLRDLAKSLPSFFHLRFSCVKLKKMLHTQKDISRLNPTAFVNT